MSFGTDFIIFDRSQYKASSSWCERATQILIESRTNLIEVFLQSPTSWAHVEHDLRNNGFLYNHRQCSNKFGSLLKKFLNPTKSGDSSSRFNALLANYVKELKIKTAEFESLLEMEQQQPVRTLAERKKMAAETRKNPLIVEYEAKKAEILKQRKKPPKNSSSLKKEPLKKTKAQSVPKAKEVAQTVKIVEKVHEKVDDANYDFKSLTNSKYDLRIRKIPSFLSRQAELDEIEAEPPKPKRGKVFRGKGNKLPPPEQKDKTKVPRKYKKRTAPTIGKKIEPIVPKEAKKKDEHNSMTKAILNRDENKSNNKNGRKVLSNKKKTRIILKRMQRKILALQRTNSSLVSQNKILFKRPHVLDDKKSTNSIATQTENAEITRKREELTRNMEIVLKESEDALQNNEKFESDVELDLDLVSINDFKIEESWVDLMDAFEAAIFKDDDEVVQNEENRSKIESLNQNNNSQKVGENESLIKNDFQNRKFTHSFQSLFQNSDDSRIPKFSLFPDNIESECRGLNEFQKVNSIKLKNHFVAQK